MLKEQPTTRVGFYEFHNASHSVEIKFKYENSENDNDWIQKSSKMYPRNVFFFPFVTHFFAAANRKESVKKIGIGQTMIGQKDKTSSNWSYTLS